MKILHIANWYPNPLSPLEGNFIRDQINLFSREADASAIAVQVRHYPGSFFRFCRLQLDNHVPGYFLLTGLPVDGALGAVLTTLLLLAVLAKHRAWRFDALHIHIAYPLLSYVGLWKHIWRRPILISEHWSAYHYNFYLPSDSVALSRLRHPFIHGFPVIAVSCSLLKDIQIFSRRSDFPSYVIPNVVPLNGVSVKEIKIPILFTAMRWVPIKDPIPMLQGLAMARDQGAHFKIILGGTGELLESMQEVVNNSSLADHVSFLGWLSKDQIKDNLAIADGFLFSSHYETFSIACAEALGAGVPLIGPRLSAISEYADEQCWQQITGNQPAHWRDGALQFLHKHNSGFFNASAIAARAACSFSLEHICAQYREVLRKHIG